METRNIKIDIQIARDWYYSKYKILKELALKVFSEEEITNNFRRIKTFEDACRTLGFDYCMLQTYLRTLSDYLNKISIATFKLEIVRKALNLGQNIHLAKDPEYSFVYCPYNPITTMSAVYRNDEKAERIGMIKSEGKEYCVFNASPNYAIGFGLAGFDSRLQIDTAFANNGFLGCASKEIAEHFGKYFGMLITEAKYGNIVDFEVINSKYPN